MRIGQIRDQYGFVAECTPMDELRTVTPVRLAGATFIGTTVDPNFWVLTQTNGGTVTQANAQVTLKTNTTANGLCAMQSLVRARYVGGSSNRFRAQIRLNNSGAADNIRRWGIFDGTDGAYFELSGTTLSVCTIKGGVRTGVASASWNGSTTTPTLTNVNSYEIYITNAKVYFVIAGVLVHTESFPTSTWTDTTNLNVRIDNTNSNNLNTDQQIEVRVATIYRLGAERTQPRYVRISSATTTVCKYGAGILHRIIVSDPTNNAITVYDNTSALAPIIAVIDPANTTTPFQLDYDVRFSTGLTIVTAGIIDITVIYE